MIGTTTLITYATVVLGLFLIPGPAVLLTLARATAGGRRVDWQATIGDPWWGWLGCSGCNAEHVTGG
jgi:threonine/homoserine/homoserine lactone efflux protein